MPASASYMDFAENIFATARDTSTPIMRGKIILPAAVNSTTSTRDVIGAAAAVVKKAAIPRREYPIISSCESGTPQAINTWAKINPETPPIVRLGVSTPPTAPIAKNRPTESTFSTNSHDTNSSEKFRETTPLIMWEPFPAISGYQIVISPTANPAIAKRSGNRFLFLFRRLRDFESHTSHAFASSDETTPNNTAKHAVDSPELKYARDIS